MHLEQDWDHFFKDIEQAHLASTPSIQASKLDSLLDTTMVPKISNTTTRSMKTTITNFPKPEDLTMSPMRDHLERIRRAQTEGFERVEHSK